MAEWIPVKNELPPSTAILVTDGKKVVMSNGSWLYRDGCGNIRVPANYGAGMDVTHWMSLPNPPEATP